MVFLTVILTVDSISNIRAYFENIVVFLDVSSTLVVVQTVSRLPLCSGRDTLNVVLIDYSTRHLTDCVDTAAVVQTVKAVDNAVIADHIIA